MNVNQASHNTVGYTLQVTTVQTNPSVIDIKFCLISDDEMMYHLINKNISKLLKQKNLFILSPYDSITNSVDALLFNTKNYLGCIYA